MLTDIKLNLLQGTKQNQKTNQVNVWQSGGYQLWWKGHSKKEF